MISIGYPISILLLAIVTFYTESLNHLQYLQVVVVPVHHSDTSLQSLQVNILSYFLLKCDLIVMEFLDLLEAQLLLYDLHLSRS